MILECDWSISVQLIPNRSDNSAKICNNSAKICNNSAKICNISAKICNNSAKFCNKRISLANTNSHQNINFLLISKTNMAGASSERFPNVETYTIQEFKIMPKTKTRQRALNFG